MLKSKKKFAILGLTAILGSTMLTGCGAELEDITEGLNNDVVGLLNESSVVSSVTDVNFTDFTFLGADFDMAANGQYDVDVSGVAKYNENKNNAYVSMSYTFDGSCFTGVKETDDKAVIDALSSAMKNQEMNDFDFVPINNVNSLNNTLKKISNSPIEDYHFKKGIVFSLGDIDFNNDEGYVSFQMRSHVNYGKTETKISVGMVLNSEGKLVPGMVPTTTYYNEEFLHTNKIYVKTSAEDLELMKLDNSFIFDCFVDYVNSGAKENYVIDSLSVDKASNLDRTMIDDIEMDKI